MAGADRVFHPEALSGAPADRHPAAASPSPGAAGGAPPPGGSERDVERALRPRSFAEFVGQERVLENLTVAIRAAQGRDESLEHVLLSGPPGLGKTSLARLVATELAANLVSTSGPALERPRDLVGILTQLRRGDVLFIDEVHRVPIAVEEYLYTAMEDFAIDITLDQGPHARVLSIALEPFTLVGATTREGLLSAPFRGRFGLFERLEPYPTDALVRILERSASLLGTPVDSAAARLLAERSRGTPRIANRFLRRARDLCQVEERAGVDGELAERALERLGVDAHGLEELDRKILRCLAAQDGRPVGLKTVAASVGEAEDTIEEAYEPHLLRSGLVQKTPRGRVVTDRGRAVVGLPPAAPGADPGGPGLFA